jgi:hypothetical protein
MKSDLVQDEGPRDVGRKGGLFLIVLHHGAFPDNAEGPSFFSRRALPGQNHHPLIRLNPKCNIFL